MYKKIIVLFIVFSIIFVSLQGCSRATSEENRISENTSRVYEENSKNNYDEVLNSSIETENSNSSGSNSTKTGNTKSSQTSKTEDKTSNKKDKTSTTESKTSKSKSTSNNTSQETTKIAEDKLVIPTKGLINYDEKKLSEDYIYPSDSIKNFKYNSTNIYENKYVKLDVTTAKRGYLSVTYKESYATDLNIWFEIQNAITKEYEPSVKLEFKNGEYKVGSPFSVKFPKKEAIYSIIIDSTINGINSDKLYAEVGKITVDGAVSVDDMLPSEEQIKLIQKSSGIYYNKYVTINTNTSSKGYIEIQYTEPNATEIRLNMYSDKKNQKGTYGAWHYYLNSSGKTTIKAALTYGNVNYTIIIWSTMKSDDGFYRSSKKAELTVKISNVPNTAPFLLSTGEVIYNSNMQFIKKAAELSKTCSNDFEKVSKIYDWLTSYIRYQPTEYTALRLYKCDLENIYNKKEGVCYDYAVVLAAMLRSQGIPCKVVFGKYSDSESGTGHAWNEVYISSNGNIKTNKLSITGGKWCRLDPTMSYGSSGKTSIEYMNNDSNYIWEEYY